MNAFPLRKRFVQMFDDLAHNICMAIIVYRVLKKLCAHAKTDSEIWTNLGRGLISFIRLILNLKDASTRNSRKMEIEKKIITLLPHDVMDKIIIIIKRLFRFRMFYVVFIFL